MKIDACNSYNSAFNGSLKIYKFDNSHSPMSDETAKYVENKFAELTKGDNAHIDILLFDRYNASNGKPDRILYREDEFMDYVDVYFKKCDKDVIVNKLISIYNGFKNIKSFKDNIRTIFKV